jgi:hypothetical protein
VLRRQIRLLSPDVRIDLEQIRTVLEREVLKRDVLEGEKAEEARKKVSRAALKARKLTQTEISQVHPETSSGASESPLAQSVIKVA